MKKITIGIVAHVDSGKTTLSEALLYLTGTIRSFGRVDKGASFLDNEDLERRRGITISSKQARFSYGETEFILIDTPGHGDFSAEMERALQVIDYAILLISAADGVKGRTKELWSLLSHYEIPVFVFFNKMDQQGTDKAGLLNAFRANLSSDVVDFSEIAPLYSRKNPDSISALMRAQRKSSLDSTSIMGEEYADAGRLDHFYDALAMCSEEAMEIYLETGMVPDDLIRCMIEERQLFPCLFGSALRQEGVEELLRIMDVYTAAPDYPETFGARVYKILRDADGSRLTMMKITGGELRTKSLLPDAVAYTHLNATGSSHLPSEGSARDQIPKNTELPRNSTTSKINQIRLYNGNKYTLADTVHAGEVCAVVGLKESYAGQGFGMESDNTTSLIIPILSYRVLLPEGDDPVKVYPYFKTLEEENPELKVVWEEDKREISVSVMGKVQIEILSQVLKERFGLQAAFDAGEVMYRETISGAVLGAGHFEPLRHYAEAVFLMQPMPRGTGLVFDSVMRTERLAKNWQRLILTHLAERRHKGVLTGSPITDIKFTLIAGKAHLKHTEGGDFRQAVYRAVRQGLMMADSVLLEPYYRFTLELPTPMIGRAMTDLNALGAQFGTPEQGSGQDISLLSGRAPVSSIKDYPADVAAYSGGEGHISFFNDGYDICHNAQEVILQKGYDPLADVRHTPDSVYCANGAGYIVPYHEVYGRLDVSLADFMASIEEGMADDGSWEDDGLLQIGNALESAKNAGLKDAGKAAGSPRTWESIGTEEIDAILAKISRSNGSDKRTGNTWKRRLGKRRGFGIDDRMGADSNRYGSNFSKQRAGIAGAGEKSGNGRKGSSVPPGFPSLAAQVFPIEEADYIVVDGYNVIFAWPELSDLARVNVDSARDSLIDTLSNFQSMTRGKVIAVFDAYRVKGHATERMTLQGIDIVFTGEEETADQYIEKFTNANGRKSRIAVVTSDGLEQIITRGQGCMLLSSRDFKKHMETLSASLREKYHID